MKTAEQIYTEWFGSDNHTTRRSLSKNNIIQAMKEYATEAVKADREKVKTELEIHKSTYLDGRGYYSPANNLILNLPIELP